MKRYIALAFLFLCFSLRAVRAEGISLIHQADIVLPIDLLIVQEQSFFGIPAQSVYIQDHVVEIESQAFANCTSLTWVRISQSVESIAENAFRNCPRGMKIYGAMKSKAQEYAYQKGFPFFDESTGKEIKPDTLPEIPIA